MAPIETFQTLPVEVLLLVGETLDKEFRVLLSLSCKRLRTILQSYSDLSLSDTATRVRCLRLLEHDHPEYLTCAQCGWMFTWHRRSLYNFHCPRTSYHARNYQRRSAPTILSIGLYPKVAIGREVVDLIARAFHRGLRHGISLSCLNETGQDQYGISRSTEARWIDQQLLVATTWKLPAHLQSKLLADQLGKIDSHVCLHWYANIALGKWLTLEERVNQMLGYEERNATKCCFCATDSKIHYEQTEGEQRRIVVKVLQNFGSRYYSTNGTEAVLIGCPGSQIDARTLNERDLQAVFESGETNTLVIES